MRRRETKRLSAWAYLGLGFLITSVWTLATGQQGLELARERLRPGPGAKEGYAETAFLYGLPALAHYLVAALDVRRFHWSDNVPFRVQVAGLLGVGVTWAILGWIQAVNPFFSSAVRIQRERGHHVITGGPYQYVRHPGYLVGSIWLLFDSLALGSWLSLVPGIAMIAALIRRTALEDGFLKKELPGYTDYAPARVRYRLIPGIW